jgi:D(-)-tartrate dehydratase
VRIVDVRETSVALKSPLRNAVLDFGQMTTSVVAVLTDVVRDGAPVAGFAFNSTGRYACGGRMRARFIPRLLGAPPETLLDRAGTNFDPAKALAVMLRNEKPGGDGDRAIAVGTIELALWDAVAKIDGVPLHRAIAARWNGGLSLARVPVYVGGGWYRPGHDARALQDEIRRYLDAGYARVKIKIGGAPLAEDLARVEAALAVLGAPENLAVDANCALSRDEALAYAGALAPYRLRWFEEPGHPHDFALMHELAERYAPPLATGENLFSTQEVENLLLYGGMRRDRDVVQVDPPLCYGVVQFARTLEMMGRHGWSRRAVTPHGGNRMSLHVAAGFGLGGCEAYPGVFSAFGGFGDDVRVVDGALSVPDRPGIGFEAQNDLYAIVRELAAAA